MSIRYCNESKEYFFKEIKGIDYHFFSHYSQFKLANDLGRAPSVIEIIKKIKLDASESKSIDGFSSNINYDLLNQACEVCLNSSELDRVPREIAYALLEIGRTIAVINGKQFEQILTKGVAHIEGHQKTSVTKSLDESDTEEWKNNEKIETILEKFKDAIEEGGHKRKLVKEVMLKLKGTKFELKERTLRKYKAKFIEKNLIKL